MHSRSVGRKWLGRWIEGAKPCVWLLGLDEWRLRFYCVPLLFVASAAFNLIGADMVEVSSVAGSAGEAFRKLTARSYWGGGHFV